MKRSLTGLFAIAALLWACSPQAVPGNGDTPVNDQTPVPAPTDYSPQPEDKAMARGPVFLDSKDLLTMESFPPQFTIALKGNLPTPCHSLRVQVDPPDPDGAIMVDVYSLADPAASCVQMLQPFEASIPLGSFRSGHYRLLVNGEQVAEFEG